MSVNVIQLYPHEYDCHCCGAVCDGSLGIPVYEDLILPNNWNGEWGGKVACKNCFTVQELLTEPMSIRDWPVREVDPQ